jgi:TusA-related sulfurtransferase
MEDAFERRDEISGPQAIVDGGGEEWSVLSAAIRRRMDRMAGGEVLEVVSQERRSRADIPTWCYLSGHDLLHMWTDGESTRFWIRKGRQ